MSFPSRFQEIANAAEPVTALAGYLRELFVSTEEDGAVLDKLMGQFGSISVDNDKAIATFSYAGDDDSSEGVVFYAPGDEGSPSPSLAHIASEHFRVALECRGGGDLAFPGGNSVDDYLNNEDEFPSMPELVFDVGQNIMIAHPEDKNATGEPVLYFIDHEDGEANILEGADSLTGAQVFLRLLTQNLFETADDEEPYFEAVCF